MSALVVGCSSISTNYDYDRDADFGSYGTFAWYELPANAPTDARQAQQRNDLLDKRIKNAVSAELEKKGMTLVTNNPDVYLVYHTGIEDKVNVTDWGYSYSDYYWGYGGRDITVTNYQQGTLIIDFIDAREKELVFRVSGQKTLDSSPPSPEKQEKTIRKAVEAMLSLYPPRR